MNRNLFALLPAAAFILLATAGLGAQAGDTLSGSITLFGDSGSPPVYLDSDRGWTPIGIYDLGNAILPSLEDGATRRWRLETSYEHDRSSGPVTLQIRLRGDDTGAVFTHPWSEGADRLADAYSNWFEENASDLSGSARGYVEARLIAPPRTPLTGRLYAVTLEAWDHSELPVNRGPSGPEVQLAYARPLPNASFSPAERSDTDASDPEKSREAALEFSLGFVESCLAGDLASYYRAQADPVRSLDDGGAMPRYRLNPPASIPGISSLEDYKRRFDYRIYPVSDIADLFPEWFDETRPWTPDDSAFLFMGHSDRLGSRVPEGVDYLVFMVEPAEDGGWNVIARPADL